MTAHFTIFGTNSSTFKTYLRFAFADEGMREVAISFISQLWIAQNSRAEGVRIKSTRLRQEFGRNIGKIIAELRASGYLNATKYKVGCFSQRYCLTPKMTRFKFEEIGEQKKLETLQKHESDRSILPPIYRKISENASKTIFDSEKAKAFVKAYPYCSQTARDWRESFITLIERGDFPAPQVDRYGRLHYFWTATPRDLRPFFKSPDGRVLAHIDVASAQVCLHASLYSPDSLEKLRFIEICQQGTFWNLLNEQLPVQFDLKNEDSKRKLKEMVFQDTFYAWRTYSSPYTEAFKRLLPELAALVIKERRNRIIGSADHISTEMQELESTIIIKTAIASVLNESPDAYICSLHDCVICTDDMKNQVKNAINAAFLGKLGFAPKLKE